MIEAQYYRPLIYNLILLLCFIQYMKHGNQRSSSILYRKDTAINIGNIFFFGAMILFIGLRPISGKYFGDTSNYAEMYQVLLPKDIVIDIDKEWLFNGIMTLCKLAKLDVSIFFLIIEIGYIGIMYWACKRLIPNNVWIAMLFCISAYSFFSYGTNGIRNGLACSIMILALSYFVQRNKIGLIIGLILSFIAYGIHHTVILPFACAIVSIYLIKDTTAAIGIWVLSIFVSLVAGGAITSIFANLGFDDRAAGYMSAEMDSDTFAHTGFRWDFLLYSAMPIWLAYYVRIKRGIKDRKYAILANTYILANAFWVMVIRANYSNRFAYLSWFLYPIVLAYPLLKLHIWKDQNKKIVLILMLQMAFTYFMWLIGK